MNSDYLVDQIVERLLNNNRVFFRRRKDEARKQALFFSPAYRDFILKMISSSSLKIKQRYKSGSYRIDRNNEYSLTKRGKGVVFTDVYDKETLPHELGHAADFWFGELSLTNNVLIEGDKTLHDIFLEEFQENKDKLYQLVMDEYKSIVTNTISPNAWDILESNLDLYNRLFDCWHPEVRKKIQQRLYENGFVDTFYQVVTKKCYSILNKKYSPILDAISSQYDIGSLRLLHHPISYYKGKSTALSEEFFANVFASKVTGNNTHFDHLIKLLPKSFNAFEKLFVIFYDHIQNNKRFNDVPIKKWEVVNDELPTISSQRSN